MSLLTRIMLVCFVFFSILFVLKADLNGNSVEITSDSTGGTVVMTDMFGNKKTCTTIIVGQTVKSWCD